MRKIAVVFGLILLMLMLGIRFYLKADRDRVEARLQVENKTGTAFKYVGFVYKDRVLFQKTSGKNYCLPEKLFSETKKLRLIAFDEKGNTFKSDSFEIANKKSVGIEAIKNNKLVLNVPTGDNSLDEIKIPKLDKWSVNINGNAIEARFRAETKLRYTLYVLGKGGGLGASDTQTNNEEVLASWEKPNNRLDSWVLFSR